jgi:site-specific DNA-methyltransferase (adenine-specific)
MYDLKENDKILNPKNITMIRIFEKYENITSIFTGRYFKIETNDNRLKKIEDINENDLICYVSKKQSKTRKMCIDKTLTAKDKFWKVISPTGVKGAYSGFSDLYILNENEVHSASYVSFKVKTEKEAQSLLSYLKTNTVNKLLSIRKVTQTVSNDTCKYIPLVPFDRLWTDDEIFKYFNLTRNEITLINEYDIV